MPISLIRSNKDNVVHGSDNGKTTGCRMRCQSVGYTKEGEMKDIVDLTCDRCKEYFARKMIRESNREEARITKEEKKRFEKAKKQGMVKEASFEEYQINREFEESERKATQGQRSNMTASQQMMQNGGYQYFGNDNAGPSDNSQNNNAPMFNSQAPVQPENNTYGQTHSQPAPGNGGSIPVYQPYNAYGQGATQSQQFGAYGQPEAQTQSQQFGAYGQPEAQTQSQQFGVYGQSEAQTQSQQFGAYGQPEAQTQSQQFGAYGQPEAQTQSQQFGAYGQPEAQTQSQQFGVYGQPEAQTQSQQFSVYGQPEAQSASYQSYESKKAETSKSDDDFLAQFMVDPAVVSVQSQAPAPAKESVNTSSILSAANDILSQYNTDPVQPSGMDSTPKTSSFNGDAASFYSNQVPVVEAGFPSIESLTNSSNEFGSIISQDSYSDIPVVQAPADTYVKAPQTSQNSTASDIPSGTPVYTPYSSQNYSSPAANQFETVAPPNVYGNSSNVQSFENLGPIGESEFTSLNNNQNSKADTASLPTIDSISPIDTSSLNGQNPSDSFSAQPQNQSGFVMPSMEQPGAQPEMYQPNYAANKPEENKAPKIPVYTPPVYNSQQFGAFSKPEVQSQQFNQQPAQNVYQQPAQNAYQQPVQNAYQQPAQNAYQQPAQNVFNPFINQNTQPKMPPKKEIRNDVPLFNNKGTGEMADSIEAALRQLGAEGMNTTAQNNGQNNMPEKEEIVPNYVAYVSSASKVLHNAPPTNTAQTTPPKKMMSAREAKKMAKIDEKFYQDLKKRGFANEMRSQRRGK